MAFSETFLEELSARNDIADVVGSYVSLSSKGGRLWGLCPFHSEKTPSFSVSPDRQMFYCFGCHKGGGVINFVMEIESLPFPDAIHFLAARAGIPIPDERDYDAAVKRRTRLFEINRETARFFHNSLSTPHGSDARAYIAKRGINSAMLTQFGLGVAPNNWTSLSDHLSKQGFTADELVQAGVARRSSKTGGLYDFFRHRLMFPVIDVRGNVIAFSGRRLDNEPDQKYLNTSDTPVFHKSKNLYGLSIARKSKADYFLLVEGNVDVISLHQAGFDSAVAPLGTAFTADQARLMHQYKQEVIIAFDADSAGQKALDRSIGILEKTGMKIRVLLIPGGKDPDDFIKAHGPDAFANLLSKRETHIEHRLFRLKQQYDLSLDADRVAYLQEAEVLLAALDSEVELEVYARRVAELSKVSMDAIKNGVKKRRTANRKKQTRKIEQEGTRPARLKQPIIRSFRYENAYSAAAEEGVIRLLLRDPTLLDDSITLTPDDFSSAFLGNVYGILRERIQSGRENTIAALTPLFQPDEMGQVVKLMHQPENLADAPKSLSDYIEKIQTEKLFGQSPDQNLHEIYEEMKRQKGVES